MIDIKKEGNLEIKRTYSNYKDKKVIPIKFKNFEEVNKRINTLTGKFLFPVCQVSYVRSYYENYAGERFTYDFNIKYKSIISKSFISSRENILEIKFSGFDANKFSSLFGERSTRFSKYNDAVQNLFYI